MSVISACENEHRTRWKFFRQWLMHPRSVASVTPSSPELAVAMLAELPEGARRVIELGGGTGVFTAAALAQGIADDDLLVLELNRDLARHLQERFPGTRVVCGDARELPALAEADGYLQGGLADVVLSGLGILSMDRSTQRQILLSAFACLREDGRFVQFTYGPRAPVSDHVVAELGLEVRRGEFVLRNVPPATVYVYAKK